MLPIQLPDDMYHDSQQMITQVRVPLCEIQVEFQVVDCGLAQSWLLGENPHPLR